MPQYHFRIKSDRRKGGIRTAGIKHAEYIDREGRYKDVDQHEEETHYTDIITGQRPIDELPKQEVLLYDSPFGKIRLAQSGIMLSRGASKETTAIALAVAQKIYGDGLQLTGRVCFKQRALKVQAMLGLDIDWQDPRLKQCARELQEEKDNDRREFERNSGRYIQRRLPRERATRDRNAQRLHQRNTEFYTLADAAAEGRRVFALPQRKLDGGRGRADVLLSRDEALDLLQRTRERSSRLRWDDSGARRRIISETAGRIMTNLQKRNEHSEEEHIFAASHVQYINREAAFQQRGGCVYKAHHLPRWAKDSPRIFFEVADAFERRNGERYKEIEFALPNELPLAEQRKIVETFISHHLKDFYYAYAIHDKVGSMSNGERHPHVHIMFSTRELDAQERKRERSPEVFFSRANSANPAQGGCKKADKWNDKHRSRYLLELREDYANIQNEALAANGVRLRVDHRSLKAQREEALAHGNKLLAKLLDRMPAQYIEFDEQMLGNEEVLRQKLEFRANNRNRAKEIISKLMLQDALDELELNQHFSQARSRSAAIFAAESDIKDENMLRTFHEQQQAIQEHIRRQENLQDISVWSRDATEQARLDLMTMTEKELWQELKHLGREKKQWEATRARLVPPPSDDAEATAAYRQLLPEIDKEIRRLDFKTRELAEQVRPIFERLATPKSRAMLQRQAAEYIEGNQAVKDKMRQNLGQLDKKLTQLDRQLADFFASQNRKQDFSAEDIEEILTASLTEKMELARRMRKELSCLRRRVISYDRALAMARNVYVKGAYKKLREDKRALKKREAQLRPDERAAAWQKISARERELDERCHTPAAAAKIQAIAAGILRKNSPQARAYHEQAQKLSRLQENIQETRLQTERMHFRAPLTRGSRFRASPPTGGGGNGNYATSNRSAGLIAAAISGDGKAAQLVARARPEEPDEWKWLSEAEKDDMRNNTAEMDRY